MDQESTNQVPNPTVPQAPSSIDSAQKNLLLAILAYIGVLVVVSYVLGKDDPFVKFHVRQGFVVFGFEIVAVILAGMWVGFLFSALINLACLVLSVLGIINVVQKKQEELPVVGSLARHIPL